MITIPPYDTKSVRDWVAFQRQFDTFWQTANNGAEQISLRTTGIAEGATYYYGFTVPVGRAFVLYSRELTLSEGVYHVDVVSAAGGYTGGTAALRTRLRAGAEATVQTTVHGGVTPSGAITEVTNGFQDNGVGQGSGIEAGGTDDDRIIKIFPAGSSLLRVTQTAGSGTWTANLRLICWELDA
ncbi:MAG: hypothetical protein CMK96_05480 [Pseudomonas sp.]|nr:hypothetical protein [Pseudomonas sp.]QDP67254.1 MAG: hypothetical protein GOVbin7368_45 [Prokaryotic dsDNA virus sp.]